MPRTLDDVLASAVSDGECLLASVGVDGSNGYVKLTGEPRAHRKLMERVLNRKLQRDEIVDHACHNDSDCEGGPTCRHRRCLNVDHLRITTITENLRASHLGNLAKRRQRGDHCPECGTRYTIYFSTKRGKRTRQWVCKPCAAAKTRKRYAACQ